MKKLFALFVSLAAIAFSASASSATYAECGPCQTENDFKIFAEGLAYSYPFGTFEYEVVSLYYNIRYHVTVYKESEPGFVLVYSEAVIGDTEKTARIQRMENALAESSYEIVVVPGSSTPSFSEHTTEGVGYYISNSDWMQTFREELPLLDLIMQETNVTEIVATVIFANGDTAKFRVDPYSGPSGCCSYISGTARDVNGNFISWGGDSSDGQDYVDPGSGGSGGGIVIIVRISTNGGGAMYRSCSKVGDGPWTCEEY